MKTTKQTKIEKLIDSANIPETLVSAVVEQSGGWEDFTEHASDVCRHGADGGFSGWIYYTETLIFTAKNRAAIVELCESMATDLGESGPVALVRGFRCLADATEAEVARTLYGGEPDEQVANALAWFALEEVSRAFMDMRE